MVIGQRQQQGGCMGGHCPRQITRQKPHGSNPGQPEHQCGQADGPGGVAKNHHGGFGGKVVQVVVVHRIALQHLAPAHPEMGVDGDDFVEPQRPVQRYHPQRQSQKQDRRKPEEVARSCGGSGTWHRGIAGQGGQRAFHQAAPAVRFSAITSAMISASGRRGRKPMVRASFETSGRRRAMSSKPSG